MSSLVSVIIATYRRDTAFEKALFSLAEQTYQNFEIVVVDDNANKEWNKKVQDIVEKFKAENKQIPLTHIVNSENRGSAKTRNAGIEAAKGEYITFLDDDDIYLPKKIETQVQNVSESDADFGITDLYLYSEGGILVDKRVRTYIKNTDEQALLKYHLMHHITGTDTLMFRKSYLEKIGGFDPIDVGDEFYLVQKAILGGGKFSYLNGCYVKAHVHTGEGNLSSGKSKIEGENKLFEYKKTFFERLDKKTVRYIRVRHFAVLAYAYLRMKKFVPFTLNIFKAVCISPAHTVGILLHK